MGADRFQRGETFQDAGTRDARNHLWVVCSNCDAACEDVVVVSITTVYDDQRQDTTCVLDVGDHEFIQHTSIVYYAFAETRKLALLNKGLATRRLRKGRPFRPDVLARIVAGFDESNQTPPECQRLLEDQGHV